MWLLLLHVGALWHFWLLQISKAINGLELDAVRLGTVLN
jgi:hypothetical protein